MRQITEITQEITEAKKLIATDMDDVPYQYRASVRTQKVQAEHKLPYLLAEIKQVTVPTRLVGLFASGNANSVEKVADFLKANQGVVVDATKMYREITDTVEKSYGRDREFGSCQYSLVVQEISQIGIFLGYQEISSPKFLATLCPDTAATFNYIKKILREANIGDQANKDLLTLDILDAIVKGNIDSKQVPVMVLGVTSTEERNQISTIFSRIVEYNFASGFTPTVKNISNLFKSQKQSDLNEEEHQ